MTNVYEQTRVKTDELESQVPRKLKCAGCQLGDHCNGEDDGCYCECTENASL